MDLLPTPQSWLATPPSQGWRFQIELPWKMMSSSGTSGHMLSMFMYMLFIVILCLYLCLCYWVCHLRIGNDNSNEEINDNPSSFASLSRLAFWNQAIFNLMHYVSTLGQETPTIVSLHCSNKWPLASGGIALKIISTEVWARCNSILHSTPSISKLSIDPITTATIMV